METAAGRRLGSPPPLPTPPSPAIAIRPPRHGGGRSLPAWRLSAAPPGALTLAIFTMMAAVPGGAGAAAELSRERGGHVRRGGGEERSGPRAVGGSGGEALATRTGD